MIVPPCGKAIWREDVQSRSQGGAGSPGLVGGAAHERINEDSHCVCRKRLTFSAVSQAQLHVRL
jgi:hypothetical protein